MNKQKLALYFLLTGFTLLCLSLLLNPAPIQAQGDPLPTPTPWGTPAPTAVPTQPPPSGTLILQAYHAPVNSWTVVQWQDALGGWHDVTGWQSQLTDGYVGWWVAPEHFGDGPFRWLLLDEQAGNVLGATAIFYLPDYANDVVLIELEIE